MIFSKDTGIKSANKRHLSQTVTTVVVGIMAGAVSVERIAKHRFELVAERATHEITQFHNRRVVFRREPAAALAYLIAADVARVADRHLAPCAEVLPKAVLQKGLRERDVVETAVGPDRQLQRRSEQRTCIDNVEQTDALDPDVDHGVIPSFDKLLAFGYRISLSHSSGLYDKSVKVSTAIWKNAQAPPV